jgi:glutaredoxin 3
MGLGGSSVSAEALETARVTVEKLVKEHNVVVFERKTCPYCRKVKGLLKSLNVVFEAVDIDQRADGDAIFQVLVEKTSRETVPNVFVKGKSIGGCDDTHELHSQGTLIPMIN